MTDAADLRPLTEELRLREQRDRLQAELRAFQARRLDDDDSTAAQPAVVKRTMA